MRLSFLIAVTSLFAIAAYGAPIVCLLHSLYASTLMLMVLVHRRETPRSSSGREHLPCVHVVSGFPLHNHLYHQPQPVLMFEREAVENPTPLRREEEGSPNQTWRRDAVDNSPPVRRKEEGSPNQVWRRDPVENSPPLRREEDVSPSQVWRRSNEDPQFEKRETIAKRQWGSVGGR